MWSQVGTLLDKFYLIKVKDGPEMDVSFSLGRGLQCVRWFNVKSGYGFIKRNDKKKDVFLHQTAIIKNNTQECR